MEHLPACSFARICLGTALAKGPQVALPPLLDPCLPLYFVLGMSKEISRPTSTALGKRSRAEIVGSQDDKKNKKETGSPSSRDEAPENG